MATSRKKREKRKQKKVKKKRKVKKRRSIDEWSPQRHLINENPEIKKKNPTVRNNDRLVEHNLQRPNVFFSKVTGPPFAKHPISRSAKGGGHLARGLKSGRSISNGIGSHQRPHCRTRRPSCTRLHVGTLDLERDWSIMTSTLKDAHRIAASLQVRTHKLERHWLPLPLTITDHFKSDSFQNKRAKLLNLYSPMKSIFFQLNYHRTEKKRVGCVHFVRRFSQWRRVLK